MRIKYEDEAWLACHPEDLWLFDKLILSKKLGYNCGPVGVNVPAPGNYIVRPCVNCMGMGQGATIHYITDESEHLPVGHFWCEIFTGRHLSVDYKIDNKGRHISQDLTVEGFRNDGDPIWKFSKWKQVDDNIPLHPLLLNIQGKYDYINCEYIGNKLIEVHLRPNNDMHNSTEVIPVWTKTTTPPGYEFVEDKDFNRLGFFVKKVT